MSVALEGQRIAIQGDCGAEDAETLMSLLQADPDAAIDLSGAGSVHTALWQVMMLLRPRVIGESGDPFVRQWIMPMVTRAPASNL